MEKLTGNTLIPISLMTAIVSCVMWVTTIYNTTQAHSESIKTIADKQERYLQDISDIKSKILVIEMEVKRINK